MRKESTSARGRSPGRDLQRRAISRFSAARWPAGADAEHAAIHQSLKQYQPKGCGAPASQWHAGGAVDKTHDTQRETAGRVAHMRKSDFFDISMSATMPARSSECRLDRRAEVPASGAAMNSCSQQCQRKARRSWPSPRSNGPAAGTGSATSKPHTHKVQVKGKKRR